MNVIYQQWAGIPEPSAYAGARAMAAYAARIGAQHEFTVRLHTEHQLGDASKFYDKFLPLWTGSHDQYEHLLVADTDIFPVDGLSQDIFRGFDGEVGLCTEPLQPDLRAKSTTSICQAGDEKWARMVEQEYKASMPRRQDGLLKVYNAGLVLWSRAGLRRARREFVAPDVYVAACKRHGLQPFYWNDQNYLHAMIFAQGLDVRELDNEWNRYVHYETRGREILGVIDPRTPHTRMVHIQLRGADYWDAATLHRVTNFKQSHWRLP